MQIPCTKLGINRLLFSCFFLFFVLTATRRPLGAPLPPPRSDGLHLVQLSLASVRSRLRARFSLYLILLRAFGSEGTRCEYITVLQGKHLEMKAFIALALCNTFPMNCVHARLKFFSRYRLLYSGTPPNGHPINTTTSLLRPLILSPKRSYYKKSYYKKSY